jgi:hypothetical protein
MINFKSRRRHGRRYKAMLDFRPEFFKRNAKNDKKSRAPSGVQLSHNLIEQPCKQNFI